MTRISKTEKSLETKLYHTPEETLASRPYIAITNGVQITVWPEFIDSKVTAIGDLFVWAYHVRIDNKTSESIQLINRYWRITDEKGAVQEVNGEGVVGEQPKIAADNFYQYSSGVHLRHPSGIMNGRYQMESASGKVFDVEIPTFSLDVPSIKPVIN